MIAEGPRKGEPSTKIMRYGLRTQPAPLVRGSSRRIMSMRFRPANISVINRRASAEAVISPAVQNNQGERNLRFLSPLESPFFPQQPQRPERCSGCKPETAQSSPAGTCSRSAARRRWIDARTVLAVKGSLRRATKRRALDCCAPFRPDAYRDGRLRREHEMPARKYGKPKPGP
jgi:hypothetical protein